MTMNPVEKILVLGSGSAGLLAAITLKRILPGLPVHMVRSPEIGTIGVGEGTTPYFPRHIHSFLGLSVSDFFRQVEPTWKLGIRYLWGPRPEFAYAFDAQMHWRWPDLPRNNGFYCGEEMQDVSAYAAMMARRKIFAVKNGQPAITVDGQAYHMENVKLVAWLEWQARALGVEITDGTVTDVTRGEHGISSVRLESGQEMTADFYVDASGFRSVLLGGAMKEPFVDYGDALLCDRAVVGPRDRLPEEEIDPYTTAETMPHGWCWRIDHEHHVNRGYVYSSAFVSDDEAEAEYRKLNPRVKQTRLVKFRSGRYRRSWVGNVAAVGNASGFVEPLEATALMVLCAQCRSIAEGLVDCLGEPGPLMVQAYNDFMAGVWDEIRDFLAVHYRFNTRLDNAFWRVCRNEIPLHGAAGLVDYYRENGPSLLPKSTLIRDGSPFGLEGYYAMLVGQQVSHGRIHEPSPEELTRWRAHCATHAATAESAITVRQALKILRDPRWRWA